MEQGIKAAFVLVELSIIAVIYPLIYRYLGDQGTGWKVIKTVFIGFIIHRFIAAVLFVSWVIAAHSFGGVVLSAEFVIISGEAILGLLVGIAHLSKKRAERKRLVHSAAQAARELSDQEWTASHQHRTALSREAFTVVAVGGFSERGEDSNRWDALLGAVYNPSRGRYETLCKVRTGFSDEDFAELSSTFARLTRNEQPERVVSELEPTHWFEPELVVEVQGSELMKSGLHTCGAENGTGIALRFPQFIRFRDDIDRTEVTSTPEIERIYHD